MFYGTALVLFLSSTSTLLQRSLLASASGIYDSSETPLTFPWNTYNYCNAPHVNAAHYELPPNCTGANLVHVSVVMRHHKRTPDNLAPSERALNPPTGWTCSDAAAVQFTYDLGGAAIAHDPTTPPNHPFASTFWTGSCDAGQLTPGGLLDASRHGKDLWELYHDKLGFLCAVNPAEIWVRTSTEDRTMQVAGAMLAAMDPDVAGKPWTVYTQPASVRLPGTPAFPLRPDDHLRLKLDRLPRPGVPVPRRECGTRSISSRSRVDKPPPGKRGPQGAPRRCLWHCRARRLV